MTPEPLLSPVAATIFQNVIEAMQDAEEIWGPEDYVPLMEAIAFEATQRIANFRAKGGAK